ncbi:Small GTPase superfamily, Rab type and Small GTP-binding protein domain and Small GTPase superfamily, SAR1-type and Small GTPase superfamily, ARF/SAR type and Small GTPase superfamily, ARF type and P-loop containing nucleoside triphosphate hydrolase domain-containing protein [Strongyloides ratti]|uniref:ADP-ribosylation factor-like protein 6 n=1 Tax=Strongyloides ratti TaxID=34506 RepID=A0A090MYJ7_STRRB|nr:Small GTPase superfamily, Rab type and Small GTP-binding protein domain and Small GTPase superfamily, SAR1-type and Small GTPase superfamily, ARF/SAR type and Small GTPase superfamily, ARF type and P-loop containing nucleoside triphosphate hydrolase domain-containing protein [Strongyloides ratti]CEF67304.1 Small GTPase superfamily, Rab type and Small GTP-binding protein domain and Small GTPase superfamily, SAR1-type and Small GTPase superfamily, ARF/SAR type and Small GTPase superfamily, ARF ty
MGLITSKLWKLLFTNKEHKVIIVGLDNAGKTTILYQFVTGETVHTAPTIGSNFEEVSYKNIHFVMWDIGGQETLRSTWSTYYDSAEFIILVIDSLDVDRIDIVKTQLNLMLQHESLSKASILIFANKQDLAGALSSAQISEKLKLTDIKTHKWQIQGCCALTGDGIDKGLEWISENVN